MAAIGPAGHAAAAPLSVADITRQAEDFEYNPHVPLRYWLRTSETLLKEVGARRPRRPRR